MMPLNEFKDFYQKDLKKFENFYDQKNIYTSMILLISILIHRMYLHLYFLEKIYVKDDNYEDDNLKTNIYQSFLIF